MVRGVAMRISPVLQADNAGTCICIDRSENFKLENFKTLIIDPHVLILQILAATI